MRDTIDGTPLILAVADLHLQPRPPTSRAERDWFAVMEAYLNRIAQIADEHEVPVLCAGDLFDHWRPSPELINFALDTVPDMYAIPGQHDLPHHRLDLMQRCGYGTLVRARKVECLYCRGKARKLSLHGYGVHLHGTGWGEKIVPIDYPQDDIVNVLVAHQYIARNLKEAYPGAPRDVKVNTLGCIQGYDFAVFGDNHRPFFAKVHSTSVVNCGSTVRRKVTEASYTPSAWLLTMLDDEPMAYRMALEDNEADVWREGVDLRDGDEEPMRELDDFIKELGALSNNALEFTEAVVEYLDTHKIGGTIRELILRALNK